eukprot:7161011-Ditylum_brightwellii.AAC.1
MITGSDISDQVGLTGATKIMVGIKKNHALQACKSPQAMMPKVFYNPTMSLKTAMVDMKGGANGGILTSKKIP